jgi:uncharacterized membrane protein
MNTTCKNNFARAALFLYLAFSSLTAFGKTPAEYRANIKAGSQLIKGFSSAVRNLPAEEYLKIERNTLAQIRSKIPATEKIQWQNGTVETDNRWLNERLDRFESETRGSAKQFEILDEISERLDALHVKISELETTSASDRTKDEDKQKLAEILRGEQYQKPEEIQQSLFEKIYDRVMKWLEEMFPRSTVPATSPVGGFESVTFVLQMLLYAVVLCAIGFLIYRFAPFFISKYRRRERSGQIERVILGERLAAGETAQNLFSEAERLAREGNLRGAIRKGYIALLCELSDKKIIRLSQHKTNRDYLRDVRLKEKELHREMNGLTLNYERHWYGFDEADNTDWENFKEGYRNAIGKGA